MRGPTGSVPTYRPLRVRTGVPPVSSGRVNGAAALIDVLTELHQHHPDSPALYVDLTAGQPAGNPGASLAAGRIAYFEAQLAALGKGMDRGVRVGGFFADATIAEWLRTRATRIPATA